jgi:diguanylate cyclase (GGDEF)-like protein
MTVAILWEMAMIRLLLVDDEINVLKSLKRGLLRSLGPDKVVVESWTEPLKALQRCRETGFDIVISDYRMPHMDGIQLLSEIKQLQPEAVRLMLTASSDFHVMLHAINTAEIFRFIPKPWSNEEISEIVQASMERRRAMYVQASQEAGQASHDALTGFPHRLRFCSDLSSHIAKARGRPRSVALLMLGLDGFRAINADNGSKVADLVLGRTAERIRRALPRAESIGRVGGDEFAVALFDLPGQEEARAVASSLAEAVSWPLTLGDRQIRVRVSIGVALQAQADAALDRLLHDSEEAMRYVKDHGGGTSQLHTDDVAEHFRHKEAARRQIEERFESLTAREREVMQMLIAGKTNKMIARQLQISDRTVENHRAKVMEKTQTKTLPDLVQMALRYRAQSDNHSSFAGNAG